MRGRPTDYPGDDKAIERITQYVAACRKRHYLPTKEGLAVEFGIGVKTLYNWADAHPDFLQVLEALMAAQASQLIQNGLKGEYNSTITKLMLTKHDYFDKQDVTSGGKPMLISDDASEEDTHQ